MAEKLYLEWTDFEEQKPNSGDFYWILCGDVLKLTWWDGKEMYESFSGGRMLPIERDIDAWAEIPYPEVPKRKWDY